MTDQYEATPIPAALQHDAIAAGVIDSAPLGGILADDNLQIIHMSPRVTQLLGGESRSRTTLRELLLHSRVLRPEIVALEVERTLTRDNVTRVHCLVEAESGEPRCVAIDVMACQRGDPRHIIWFQDVTASSQLQQFQLLAEIGRGRLGREFSTPRLAEQLVDAMLRILGVDIAVLMLGGQDGLRPIATRGLLLEDGFVLQPRDRPYVAKALQTGRPVVSDGSEWDASDQEMTGTHYIVPLLASGAPIGTLHIAVLEDRGSSSHGIGFSHTLDMAFLDALSAYAGSAIASTRLFEEVREERLKLKTVVDFIPEGVILFTGRGDVLAANETAREIAEREWVNINTDRRAYRMLDEHGQVLRRVDWPLFRLQHNGMPILGDVVQLDFGSRQKVISVSILPVPSVSNDAIPTYVATFRDITDERARRAEREGFLEIVSHELRSPLTPLTGFLQMVRKQVESGEEVDADLVQRAEHQVGRLARLIDRVLDLSRLERKLELCLETVDLREIVTETASLWNANPAGVRIDVVCEDGPVIVHGDADRLQQVLTNLIDNAVKHSPQGEAVEIRVNGGASARLTVRDRGAGISEEDLPRIFDRFFSGSHQRGGIGIGLYITKQFVEAHQGRITAHSEPGEGTTFEVTLPSLSH